VTIKLIGGPFIRYVFLAFLLSNIHKTERRERMIKELWTDKSEVFRLALSRNHIFLLKFLHCAVIKSIVVKLIQGKDKVVPLHAAKACRGVEV